MVLLALAFTAACGGSPNKPDPIGPPPPTPVVNVAPSITAVTVQGTRQRQPANFADLSETVAVTATVTDAETAADLMQYNWSATLGSFSGTGPRVSWVAPAAAVTPAVVTITLQVVERYGTNLEHRVSRTTDLALHDSPREVGNMSRQFLLDFSDTNLKDASYIMRNFGTSSVCPQPNEVISERSDVTNHYTNFRMIEARIGTPLVNVNFGGACAFRGKLGDACAVVPAYWHSFSRLENRETKVDGNGVIAAAYSKADSRWWLCASDYDGRSLLAPAAGAFYLR